MIYIKFCRAPSGRWVGWTEYENGIWFGFGETMDSMVAHVKNSLASKKRISRSSIMLDTKQSQMTDCPIDKMSKMIKTKYWDIRGNKTPMQTSGIPMAQNTFEYNYHEYEIVNNELIVYGCIRRKIASYKLQTLENSQVKKFHFPLVVKNDGE